MFEYEDVFKLLLALILGGVIGAEREFGNKIAGFRTIILICVGATLISMISLKSGEIGNNADSSRIASNIVSGIGFLGAGVIIRNQGQVLGLTTAATIWMAAALGMAVGYGLYIVAIMFAFASLVVLMYFPLLEKWIDSQRDKRIFTIVTSLNMGKYEEFETMFKECGLLIRAKQRTKAGDTMRCTFRVFGIPDEHNQAMERLFADSDVQEFQVS